MARSLMTSVFLSAAALAMAAPLATLAQDTPPWSYVCPNGSWGGNGARPNCGGGGGPRGPVIRQPRGPTPEELAADARYHETWNAAQAAFDAKNYALAVQLYQQSEAQRPGPRGKANLALAQGLLAWNSDPQAALEFFKQRRGYLDQFNDHESAGLKAGNDRAIGQLTAWLAAHAQAAHAQQDLPAAGGRAAAALARYQSPAEDAAAARRQAAAIAAADARVQGFQGAALPADELAREKADDAAIMATGRQVTQDGRTYQASGRGIVGGVDWITGYNVQSADPAVAKKAHEMMAEQMRLAGMDYADGVDFARYNFVLGIAASTDTPTDLASRVIFDEYDNGQHSAANQAAYAALKGRQFDELACHSNGAMVCLAALENHDVVADKVVLYGPQITVESLKMWDELVRQHKVGSVQIYVNAGDPVPPLSLAFGGGAVGATLVSSLALMHPASFVDVIHETAPELAVRSLPCASRPDLDCHGMAVYKTNVQKTACQSKSSGARVPGTALPGRPETAYVEPPSPC